jgi:spore coat protein A, manganese oxidase
MRKSIVAVGLAALVVAALQAGSQAFAATGVSKSSSIDFNGDGNSDFVSIRNTGGGPSGQVSFFTSALGGYSQVQWGLSTDTFVACDFDGDGKDDYAVWRPGAPTVARFYILQSATNSVREEAFGQTGDNPKISADYDGDGKCDVAVYRDGAGSGQQSYFYYRGSFNNPGGNVTLIPWGLNGDFPTTGDYDGDGKFDFAVQRGGVFWIRTATGSTSNIAFGLGSDVILRGDYDGDGKSDLAVARGSGGGIAHFIRLSSSGFIRYGLNWGLSATDSLVPGDYDGDGKTDLAVWRPSSGVTWIQNSSSGSTTQFKWGQTGDSPLANSQTS